MKIELLQSTGIAGMKEAAMRGQDQRFAVQQPGQCQIVGEEIDGVDMDDVAIVQMVQHGWCERIATST